MVLKLAWRNLVGGGVRSLLNVFILSVVLVTIIGFHGLFVGWQRNAENGMIRWHIADGQYWQKDYDPYDPFSFDVARSAMPKGINDAASVEFLIDQGVIYPQGRMKNIILKGVEEEQVLLELPTEYLRFKEGRYKLMLGYRTAKKLGLSEGDRLMLRWRDVHGSFDAREFEIVHIFTSPVLTIDQGQVWLGLEQMREMLDAPGEVTYFSYRGLRPKLGAGWIWKTQDELLSEFRALFAAKMAGVSFMYVLLLFLAMIAVFDTQVLAMFKRRREIGMMMALGLRSGQIIKVFTLEGLLSGLLAVGLGALWGTPLLLRFSKYGLRLPEMMDNYGIDGFLDAMYPQYSLKIVVLTIVLINLILLVVSYLPVRSISKMSPVSALK
ncbi:MAG: FtsX-like permease family protein [Candidatus Cloacimonetes bacterium]|nr:FtsX-like permease family protein [Candidatus Cloacimonadota bacterium]